MRLLILYLIVLNSYFNILNSAENAGMPQLDTEFWFSQIFWLILTFGTLFVILSKFVLPRIKNNLERRKSQIMENIEIADKQKQDSEKKLEEYSKIISDTKIKAKELFNLSKDKIQSELIKKKIKLDDSLNENIKNVEMEITKMKERNPEKITKIAIEATSEIFQKFVGLEINQSKITVVVNEQMKNWSKN